MERNNYWKCLDNNGEWHLLLEKHENIKGYGEYPVYEKRYYEMYDSNVYDSNGVLIDGSSSEDADLDMETMCKYSGYKFLNDVEDTVLDTDMIFENDVISVTVHSENLIGTDSINLRGFVDGEAGMLFRNFSDGVLYDLVFISMYDDVLYEGNLYESDTLMQEANRSRNIEVLSDNEIDEKY